MNRPIALALAASAALLGLSATASAQQPPLGYGAPPPTYGAAPPPGYGAPPPAYGGYSPYGSPGYSPYGGYTLPPGPPPPPPPPKATCCTWSARVNPFDLLFRRLSFEGEVAVVGPLTVQLSPSWIWGSPVEQVDASGFAIAADVGFYVNRPMKGFFVKAHVGYETFEATLSDPDGGSDTETVASPILGAMIGSSTVFGRNGGFAISGGIGIGVATADRVHLEVKTQTPDGDRVRVTQDYYDKAGRIQLLGSFALGVAF
jgi:hypothetical protein